MGRLLTKTTDQAEQLNDWVQELAKKTNTSLNGAELYNVDLCFRDPFKYFNGFVGMDIKFAKPTFLNEKDEKDWYSRVTELAEKKFGLNTSIGGLEWASINFEESSEEELYVLTPKKEAVIKSGFDRIRKYVEWYCSAVNDYNNVIQAHTDRLKQHLKNLETLSE